MNELAKRPSGQRWIGLFNALVINAVPFWGLTRGGWAGSTLLVLYWGETLFGTVLNGLRIALHWRLTRKRGHWGAQPPGRRWSFRQSFLAEYLGISLVFTFGHGIMLAAFLFVMSANLGVAPPDRAALERGLAWLTGALVLSFVIDLFRLRRQPFAWIRRVRDQSVQRVFIVHMTIILGAVMMAWLGKASAFFLVFALFKLLIDMVNAFGTEHIPDRPPGCLAGLMHAVAPKEDTDAVWRKSILDQRQSAARDEEVVSR
ncbi:MAG: DUF6498-containing protein [Acidobacteriota bacterium]